MPLGESMRVASTGRSAVRESPAPPLHIVNDMPAHSRMATDDRVAADAAAFDVSDVDEPDPAGADLLTTTPRQASAQAVRADRAAAVLAMYALLVFKDRRRKRRHDAVALPGV